MRRSALALLGLSMLVLGAAGPASPLERGRQLFVGEVPSTARMVGHPQPLPAAAVRCSNCHGHAELDRARGQEDFGPMLGRQQLTASVARRGGPSSVYDRDSLCRLLREGVDPAHVMISQAMPRYTLSAPDCEALWTFLTVR